MEDTRCPHCSVRVIPLEDGDCPACGRNVLQAAEADDQPLRGDEIIDASLEESLADEASRKFGFAAAVGWCLMVLAAQFGVGLVLAFTGVYAALKQQGQLVYVVFSVVGDLLMTAIAWNNFRPAAARQLALRPISPFQVVVVLLLVAPLKVLCEELSNWLSYAADRIALSAAAAYTGIFEDRFDAIAEQPWIVMFLVGCLAPGICEELFFRGFLGRGLIGKYGTIGGVALSSLLFGLSHVDPVHASWTFALGVFLHCVYLATRSLLAPMLLHVLFNLLGFAFFKLQLDGTVLLGGIDDYLWMSPPLVGAAFIAAAALLYLLARPSPPGKLPLATAAVASLAFAAVLCVVGPGWFDPHGAWAHYRRGATHSEQQQYEEAVNAYTAAIEADPETAEAYFGRGEAHRMLDDLPQALRDVDRGLERDPTSAWGHADRAETLRLLGRHDEALADSDRAIELDPYFAWGYTVRGSVHSDNGDSRPAIDDFKQSLRWEPQNPFTLSSLAWEYAHAADPRSRDTKEAIRCAIEACELTEWADAEKMATLAAAYAQDSQFQMAVEYQRDALEAAPDDLEAEFRELLEAYEAGW